MAWRFRKRVKILPGVYLNFSKKGISTTVGVKGASVNFGKNGTYLNTSIAGTGLYNRQKISTPTVQNQQRYLPQNNQPGQTCPNCKGSQPAGLNVCGWCGLNFQEYETQRLESKRKDNKTLLILLTSVTILVIGFFSVVIFLVPSTQRNTTEIASSPTAAKSFAGNFNNLTYKSKYDDVVKEFGEPDKEVSSFPPDAIIPNTIMYYGKQNEVVFVVWEFAPKGKPYDRTQTHYMGTKGLSPERVLHISQERFRVMVDAYKFKK